MCVCPEATAGTGQPKSRTPGQAGRQLGWDPRGLGDLTSVYSICFDCLKQTHCFLGSLAASRVTSWQRAQLPRGPVTHSPGRGWISFSCVQFSAMTPRPVSLAALLVSSCLGALIWGASQAAGHGMLSEPAARNVLANSDYCPQCLSAGGERPGSGWMGRAAAAAASGHTRRTSFL